MSGTLREYHEGKREEKRKKERKKERKKQGINLNTEFACVLAWRQNRPSLFLPSHFYFPCSSTRRRGMINSIELNLDRARNTY